LLKKFNVAQVTKIIQQKNKNKIPYIKKIKLKIKDSSNIFSYLMELGIYYLINKYGEIII
jgi:hypothetical protein